MASLVGTQSFTIRGLSSNYYNARAHSTAPTGKNPIPSPSSSGKQNALDYVPKGTAEIQLEDGSHFQVPANSFSYVQYDTVIQGLPDSDGYVTLFDDMKSFKFENDSIVASMIDGRTRTFTPNYGEWVVLNFPYAFLAPTANGRLNWRNITQVTFVMKSQPTNGPANGNSHY